jgi:small nuclear ribonucleoprotein (snRNP)-like protein
MTIVQDQFRELLGKELAVVCVDGNAYKGRLEKFDDEAIVLHETLELRKEDLRWVEPTVSPRMEGSDLTGQIDAYGVVDTQKLRVSLRTVIIRINTISRIWPWIPFETTTDIKRYALI